MDAADANTHASPVEWKGIEISKDYIHFGIEDSPWSYDYAREGTLKWSSCVRVSSGNATIKNLKPSTEYIIDLYKNGSRNTSSKWAGSTAPR